MSYGHRLKYGTHVRLLPTSEKHKLTMLLYIVASSSKLQSEVQSLKKKRAGPFNANVRYEADCCLCARLVHGVLHFAVRTLEVHNRSTAWAAPMPATPNILNNKHSVSSIGNDWLRKQQQGTAVALLAVLIQCLLQLCTACDLGMCSSANITTHYRD